MSTAESPQQRLLNLDALRIFAALWVLTFHLSGHGGNYPQLAKPYDISWIPNYLDKIFALGFLGVDIFFIISGIVIAHTAARAKSSKEFMKSRFLRLFPSYFLITALAIIFVPFSLESAAPRLTYFVSLTGVQFWSGHPTLVGTTWTLAFEVLFYVIVALVLFFHNRFKARSSSLLVAATSLTILIILSPAMNETVLSTAALFPYGTYFALGMSLFGLRNQQQIKSWKILFALNLMLSLDLLANRINLGNPETLNLAFLSAGLILSLIILISFTRPKSVNRRLSLVIQTLALMTYPIYLMHEFIGMASIGWLMEFGIGAPVSISLTVVIVCLFSWLVVSKIEPFLKARLKTLLSW